MLLLLCLAQDSCDSLTPSFLCPQTRLVWFSCLTLPYLAIGQLSSLLSQSQWHNFFSFPHLDDSLKEKNWVFCDQEKEIPTSSSLAARQNQLHLFLVSEVNPNFCSEIPGQISFFHTLSHCQNKATRKACLTELWGSCRRYSGKAHQGWSTRTVGCHYAISSAQCLLLEESAPLCEPRWQAWLWKCNSKEVKIVLSKGLHIAVPRKLPLFCV